MTTTYVQQEPGWDAKIPEITITKEMRDETHGRYVARISGIEAEAELTFTLRGHGVISADHTGAPEALRGTGAVAALVDYLVADARANGFRVIPICPYIQAQYRHHPDWADVFTSKPGEKPHVGDRPT